MNKSKSGAGVMKLIHIKIQGANKSGKNKCYVQSEAYIEVERTL